MTTTGDLHRHGYSDKHMIKVREQLSVLKKQHWLFLETVNQNQFLLLMFDISFILFTHIGPCLYVILTIDYL